MVKNVKSSYNKVNVNISREGYLSITCACEILELSCKSFCSKDSITNVMSLADVAKDYQVKMDAKCDKATHVHTAKK